MTDFQQETGSEGWRVHDGDAAVAAGGQVISTTVSWSRLSDPEGNDLDFILNP